MCKSEMAKLLGMKNNVTERRHVMFKWEMRRLLWDMKVGNGQTASNVEVEI